jgi:flagellar P-ring protein precursor FlgI
MPEFLGDPAAGVNFNTGANTAEGSTVLVSGNTNVEDLVNALNAIGASAQDIIAILQAIKAAGALYGDLIIM